MALGNQFTGDAARRIVKAVAEWEKGNPGKQPYGPPLSGGIERWAWGKIDGTADDNGLYSWKLQKIGDDGQFADNTDVDEFTHNALEINGNSATDSSIQRMIYVGGSDPDSGDPTWMFGVGGGGGVVRITLNSGLSGQSTISATIVAGGSGTVTLHNRLALSGSSGAIGYAAMIGGVYDLIQLAC